MINFRIIRRLYNISKTVIELLKSVYIKKYNVMPSDWKSSKTDTFYKPTTYETRI